MVIGFDVSQTGRGKAGCGYYADALIRCLLARGSGPRYRLFPDFGDHYFDRFVSNRFSSRGHRVVFGPRHLTRESAAQFWTSPKLDEALGHPDVVHANNYWCPVQPIAGRVIYTLYDLGFLREPSWTTEENRVACAEGVVRAAVAADWVVAISAATRADFLRHFPAFPAERIRVIHPCSRFEGRGKPGRRPRKLSGVAPRAFWLTVGTLEPRKNLFRLTTAYRHYLAAGGAPMPLVLAGGAGWMMNDFEPHLARLGIASQVIRTGYLEDEEIAWLYENCYANLYPSLFEGFGLPVLEGLQFGAPTIASSASSIPEVAGNAALLIDPEDEAAWAEAMLRLLREPGLRDRLAREALLRATDFDWRASATSLQALYNEAVEQPKRSTPPAAAKDRG